MTISPDRGPCWIDVKLPPPSMPPKSSRDSSQSQSSYHSASQKPAKRAKLSRDASLSSNTGKLRTVKLDAKQPSGAHRPKFDPLTAFSQSSSASSSQEPSTVLKLKKTVKGKERVIPSVILPPEPPGDDRLWVDIYEPKSETELAVHVRKVEDVRRWLREALEGGPSGKLKKYRRILALTGPAGSAKTTTLRILAQELNFEILEWRNAMDQRRPFDTDDDAFGDIEYEGLASRFDSFISRSAHCANLFSNQASSSKQHVVLLEDLPNILHTGTQERFQAVLEQLVNGPPSAPVVVIISDAGNRGEAIDERPGGWNGRRDPVVDIRSVLGKTLLEGPYVTKISFNPIAPTLLRKALQAILSQHYSHSPRSAPPKEAIEMVIDSSNGDIRSAVMTLQFACIVDSKDKKKGKKGSKPFPIEAITKREQSLALFHLLGKVLYNKRKGDPPSSSLTIRDKGKEKEFDDRLVDPPPLPSFLSEHDRKASRIDVDTIYADSPIDSSLFSLYIQQNYVQFCDTIEQIDSASEYLSWVDAGCGADSAHTDIANPFRFHLLTLGTIHSLPCPVPRRGQKMYKPDFFEMLKTQRAAEDSVQLVRRTLELKRWNKDHIATELGGWLKAKEKGGLRLLSKGGNRIGGNGDRTRFWSLPFVRSGAGFGDVLGEEDGGELDSRGAFVEDSEPVSKGFSDSLQREEVEETQEDEWWREDDDIEDF